MKGSDLDGIPESIEEIEEIFHETLQKLALETSLAKFRGQYESLHQQLLEAHEKNQKLMEKSQQLNKTLLDSADRVASTLGMSSTDQRTITELRNEFERVWKSVESFSESESQKEREIERLKEELKSAKDQVASREEENEHLQAEMNILKSEIESGSWERDNLKGELNEAKTKAQITSNIVETCQQMINELSSDLDAYLKEGNIVGPELEEQRKIWDETGQLLKEAEKEQEEKSSEILECKYRIEQAKKDVIGSRTDISLLKTAAQVKRNALQRIEKRREQVSAECQQVLKKLGDCNAMVEYRDHEMKEFEEQGKKLTKEYETSQVELKQLKDQRKDLAAEQQLCRQQLKKLEMEKVNSTLGFHKTENDVASSRSQIDALMHEANETKQQIAQEKKGREAVSDQISRLENEFFAVKLANTDQRIRIMTVMDEMRSGRDNIEDLKESWAQFKEQSIAFTSELNEIQALLPKRQHEIARMESVCQTAQVERDTAAQALQKIQMENDSISGDIAVISSSIAELKDAIRRTDDECLKCHIDLESHKLQIKRLTKKMNQLEADLEKKRQEATRVSGDVEIYSHIAEEASYDIAKEMKTIVNLRKEKDDIDQQHLKKVKEVQTMAEKARALTSMCRMSAAHYREKSQKVEELQNAYAKELATLAKRSAKVRSMEILKRHILRLEKQLLIAQSQTKAMEVESETVINVHRWTLMESANPEQWNLISLRLNLLGMIAKKTQKSFQLKNRAAELRQNLEKMEHRIQTSYGGQFDEQYQSLLSIFKRKEKQLKDMEQDLKGKYIPAVDEQKEQIKSARSRIRQARLEEQKKKPGKEFAVHEPPARAGHRPKSHRSVPKQEQQLEIPILNLSGLNDVIRQRPKCCSCVDKSFLSSLSTLRLLRS